MSEDQIDNGKLEALLKFAAQRLGSTPEALKEAAQNGDLTQMMSQTNAGQAENAAMQQALTDPEAAKKLLATPQAQAIIKMLQGKQ